jgi:type III secretory pathway component EscR
VGVENVGSFTLIVLGVLLATSFLKIFTTLTLLRCGIGINQWEGGLIVMCVSLALTFFIMEPFVPLKALSNNLKSFPETISPFLRIHIDSEIYQRLSVLRKSALKPEDNRVEEGPTPSNAESDVAGFANDPPKDSLPLESRGKKKSEARVDDFGLLVASFTISQLRDAFEIGFLVLVPFLVIDLLVMNALMVLGARSVSVELFSIPLKILLFFSVDGWTMITEKLLKEFM